MTKVPKKKPKAGAKKKLGQKARPRTSTPRSQIPYGNEANPRMPRESKILPPTPRVGKKSRPKKKRD